MVAGRIEFAADRPHLTGVDVHVWIEDTTYADAPAVRLFHHRMSGVSYAGDAEGIPFTLDYTSRPLPGRTHTLSVLVDLDADARPGRGDYISVEAVAVPADETVARVRVQRIG
jgi:hypothetical protein